MKTTRNLTLIRLLMIISQMVLTLFVGQWLWAEYIKERDRFDQEFSRKFQESEIKVMDSMLMVKVLNPMIRDSSYRRLTMNITLDSVKPDNPSWKGTEIINDGIHDSCRRVIAITTNDPFSLPPSQYPAQYYTFNSSDDVFLQGMKLVVQRIEDSLSVPGGYMQRTVILKDTSRIKKLFAGTIREVDPSIRITWTTDQPPWDTTVIKQKRFFYEMPVHGYTLAATIEHPFMVIVKEIIPSIFFSLALLVLTGLSFVFAFRSLKNQIQLNSIRSDFMSNITHELKTPVSTVKIALEALKRFNTDHDPEKTDEYLTMASREMDRLDQLISQVLKSSMYDNGIQLIEKEELDLRKVTADVIEKLQPRLTDQGVHITVEGNEDSFVICADCIHLQGVMMNLVENCLNYGGEQPEIRIMIKRSDHNVQFMVSDNGPGIPEEYLGKVFDKFFRVPNGNRHDVKGYGLGLSYASMVMRLHGGTIRAENIREGGVRFILTFPQKPA